MIAAIPILVFDLAGGSGGLIEGGQTGQWDWGAPTQGPVGLGNCWGTNLNGPYLHDSVDFLEVPLPDLSGLTDPVVVIRHYFDVAAGDHGLVQVDSGGGFSRVEPVLGYPTADGFSGASGSYVEHAFDLSGAGTAPRVRLSFGADLVGASDGWFVQTVTLWDGDVVPPQVAPVLIPSNTQDLVGPYDIELSVMDDTDVASVTMFWTSDGAQIHSVPLSQVGGELWHGDIPAQHPDTTVVWWVEADDGTQAVTWPAVGTESFRVFLAAPRNLSAPVSHRNIATKVDLSWDPPETSHEVEGYEVRQTGGSQVFSVDAEGVTVPLTPQSSQRFEVRALYAAGVGDATPALQLDYEVPQLTIEPAEVFAADEVYLELSGASLYLLQGATDVDLGQGVAVLQTNVIDTDRLTARVRVDPAPAAGPRDVVVVTSGGEHTFPSALQVLGAEDAPHIVSVSPGKMTQGEELRFTVQASTLFAGPVRIDAGDDFVVTQDIETDGAVVRFGLAANLSAQIGVHTVVIDDGARLWPVDVEVLERTFTQSGCAVAPGGGAAVLFTGLLLVGARRRRQWPASSPHSAFRRASRPHPVR